MACWSFAAENLDEDQQMAFTHWFGPLDRGFGRVRPPQHRFKTDHLADISNVDYNGDVVPPGHPKRVGSLANQLWHSDSSFQKPSAKFSILTFIRCRPGAAIPNSPTCAPPMTRCPSGEAGNRQSHRRALGAAFAHQSAGRRQLHRRAARLDPAGEMAAGARASVIGSQIAVHRRTYPGHRRHVGAGSTHPPAPSCLSTRRSRASSMSMNGRWAIS